MSKTADEERGVKNLDELCLTLQVPPVPEGEDYEDIVLFGKSGKAYALSHVLLNVVLFVRQSLVFMTSTVGQLERRILELEETEDDAVEPDKES